jgi:hypothetical protein
LVVGEFPATLAETIGHEADLHGLSYPGFGHFASGNGCKLRDDDTDVPATRARPDRWRAWPCLRWCCSRRTIRSLPLRQPWTDHPGAVPTGRCLPRTWPLGRPAPERLADRRFSQTRHGGTAAAPERSRAVFDGCARCAEALVEEPTVVVARCVTMPRYVLRKPGHHRCAKQQHGYQSLAGPVGLGDPVLPRPAAARGSCGAWGLEWSSFGELTQTCGCC